jgi:hypothetical protein
MSLNQPTQVEITPKRRVGRPPEDVPFLVLNGGYPKAVSRGRSKTPDGKDCLQEGLVDEWLSSNNVRRVLLTVKGDIFDLGLTRMKGAPSKITTLPEQPDPEVMTQIRKVFKAMIVAACLQRDSYGVHPRTEFRDTTRMNAPLEEILHFMHRSPQLLREGRHQGFDGLMKYSRAENVSPRYLARTAFGLKLASALNWPDVKSSLEQTEAFLDMLDRHPQAHLESPDLSTMAQKLNMSRQGLFTLARIKTAPDGTPLAEKWGWGPSMTRG